MNIRPIPSGIPPLGSLLSLVCGTVLFANCAALEEGQSNTKTDPTVAGETVATCVDVEREETEENPYGDLAEKYFGLEKMPTLKVCVGDVIWGKSSFGNDQRTKFDVTGVSINEFSNAVIRGVPSKRLSFSALVPSADRPCNRVVVDVPRAERVEYEVPLFTLFSHEEMLVLQADLNERCGL